MEINIVFLVSLVFLVFLVKLKKPYRPDRPDRLFILLTPLFLIACSQDYDPRLPAYLKAEKELRSRVAPERGLDDSISLLAKKFKINPEKQIAGLKDKPRAWQSLIDELLDKKNKDKDKSTGKREKK